MFGMGGAPPNFPRSPSLGPFESGETPTSNPKRLTARFGAQMYVFSKSEPANQAHSLPVKSNCGFRLGPRLFEVAEELKGPLREGVVVLGSNFAR